MLRLAVLFLVVPTVEFALLLKLGGIFGVWPTVAFVVVTGLLGSALARQQGMSAWRRFNERISGGGVPGQEMLDGVIILVAGALLITPGILTDILGFCGLIPSTRALLRAYILARLKLTAAGGYAVFQGSGAEGSASGKSADVDGRWAGAPRARPTHASAPDAETNTSTGSRSGSALER